MDKQVTLAVAAAALLGCATVRLPQEQLRNNAASIRGAEELGAEAVPSARLFLQLAKDQTAKALRLADEGDPRALMVLSRAQSDADLSLSLAREATVHQAAVRAAEQLKLRQLSDRSAP